MHLSQHKKCEVQYNNTSVINSFQTHSPKNQPQINFIKTFSLRAQQEKISEQKNFGIAGQVQSKHLNTKVIKSREEGSIGDDEQVYTYEQIKEDPIQKTQNRLRFCKAIAKVAWETKAENVVCLDVSKLVNWTNYIVISTVFSRPQLQAVLFKVRKEAAENFEAIPSIPAQESSWEVLDFGDVLFNCLSPEMRDFYELEALYIKAEQVDLEFQDEVDEEGQDARWQKSLS